MVFLKKIQVLFCAGLLVAVTAPIKSAESRQVELTCIKKDIIPELLQDGSDQFVSFGQNKDGAVVIRVNKPEPTQIVHTSPDETEELIEIAKENIPTFADLTKDLVAGQLVKKFVDEENIIASQATKAAILYGLYEADNRLDGHKPTWRQKGKKIARLATNAGTFLIIHYLCAQLGVNLNITQAPNNLKKLIWYGVKELVGFPIKMIADTFYDAGCYVASKILLNPTSPEASSFDETTEDRSKDREEGPQKQKEKSFLAKTYLKILTYFLSEKIA